MLVGGDAFMRIRLKQMLVENGLDVAEVANGVEAISVYRDFQPHMVFIDIDLPDKGGLDALKEIKGINPNALVAMLVVEGQQALVMEALRSGAVDFLTKPFDEEEVLGAINKALG